MRRRYLAATAAALFALGMGAAGAQAAPTDAPTGFTADTNELRWRQVDSSTSYVVSTSDRAPGGPRTTTTATVTATCAAGTCTYDPPVKSAGTTWWYGVRNNATGSNWAATEVSIAWPTAPVLSVTNLPWMVLTWPQVGSYVNYVLAVSDGPGSSGSRNTRYVWVPNACSGGTCSYQPLANIGSTEYFGLRAADAQGESPWTAVEASYAWPQRFGLNSANGLGSGLRRTMIAGGVKWAREELWFDDDPLTAPSPPSQRDVDAYFDTYLSQGMAIQSLLNTDDGVALSRIDTAAFARWAVEQMERYGAEGTYWASKTPAQQALAPDSFEIINEPDCKPCGSQIDPVSYARLYMATYRAAHDAGLTVDAGGRLRLGFYVLGDYEKPRGSGNWSQVARGEGWLSDALAAADDPRTPGNDLADAINAAGAVVIHPYGDMWTTPGTWTNVNTGWGRIETLHDYAVTSGLRVPMWITEAGYQVGCPADFCVADQAAQSANVHQMVTDVKARSYITRFDYFNAVDYTGWTGGLFDARGTARTAWTTYSYDITH